MFLFHLVIMLFVCILLVVVNIRISTHSIIEADVQVVPQPAVQNHVSHHINSVLDLKHTHLIH